MCGNKKVLLRERKRHTARRAASVRYAGGGGGSTPSSHGGGGTPGTPPTIQTWPGSLTLHTPHTIQTWDGVPPPHHHTWDGVHPHHQTWDEVPPTIQTWDGVLPPSYLGWGIPPTIQTWDGVPPPPPMVNRQTFPSINIAFPRTTYASGNKAKCSNHNLFNARILSQLEIDFTMITSLLAYYKMWSSSRSCFFLGGFFGLLSDGTSSITLF